MSNIPTQTPHPSPPLARLLESTESASWLDRPATVVRALVRPVADGPAGGVLRGEFLGHPLHPALVAVPIGAKVDDPLAMYLNDVFTIPANLSGMPAISIPSGLDGQGLPVGLQLTAPVLEESRLLRAAHALEQAIGFDARPSLIAELAA